MADAVVGGLTRLALCWRVERADGVAFGLTSADRALTVDGFRYAASPGMTPSAVVAGLGFQAEPMTATGAAAGPFADAELDAGRLDGARVRLFAVDRRDPDGEAMPLFGGVLADAARRLDAPLFDAELRGAAAGLEGIAAPACAPMCRAALGDADCQMDMDGREADAIVAGAGAGGMVLAEAPADMARFVNGRLRVLTGPMAGLDRRIAAVGAAGLTGVAVMLDPPLSAPAGARVRLREGCDRRFATCAGRFGNALNFRGEPHVPGTDALLLHD